MRISFLFFLISINLHSIGQTMEDSSKKSADELFEKISNLDNNPIKELDLIQLLSQNLKLKDYEEEINAIRLIALKTKNDDIRNIAIMAIISHAISLEGEIVKDFDLKNSKGKMLKFSDFRGQYLVLDFWATWCGPCVQQMKKLPRLKKKYNGSLDFICISRDYSEEDMTKFLEKNNYAELNFHFDGVNENFVKYFDIKAIPRYIIIDPNGRIIDYDIINDLETELALIMGN